MSIMSDKKQNSIKTSISAADINAAHTSGGDRVKLFCKNIQGFMYIKLPDAVKIKNGKEQRFRRWAWRLRYRDQTGKIREYTIGNHTMQMETAVKAANKIIFDMMQASLQGGFYDPLDAKKQAKDEALARLKVEEEQQFATLGAFYERIYTPYQEKKRYGKGTLNIIKLNFEHLFNRDMASLSDGDVLDWQAKRRAGTLKENSDSVGRATIVRDYGTLKTLLNYAVKKKVIDRNPLTGVDLDDESDQEIEAALDAASELSEKRKAFTPQQRQAIETGLALFAEEKRAERRSSRTHGKAYLADLDAVEFPHWFIPFCRIADLTGMRPSDIRELQWQNVDFNKFDPMIRFTPVKTRHKVRTPVEFPMYDELEAVMRALYEQQGKPAGDQHVFKSERTGGIMDKKAYRRHWLRVLELGGIPESLDFYSFRHNFISERVADPSIPLMEIAKLVGHSSPDMIAQNYYRPTVDVKRRAAAGSRANTIAIRNKVAV